MKSSGKRNPQRSRLCVVEEENHRLVVHPRLHEAQLQVLVPLHRAVVLRDFNLIRRQQLIDSPMKDDKWQLVRW